MVRPTSRRWRVLLVTVVVSLALLGLAWWRGLPQGAAHAKEFIAGTSWVAMVVWFLTAVFVGLLTGCVLLFPKLLIGRSRLILNESKISDVATDRAEEMRLKVEADRLKAENDIRTTMLQGAAGLVLLTGAALTGLSVWVTAQRNIIELGLTRESQVTERFTKAIALLGDRKNPAIRLGGIYALERISKDSPEKDRGPIMEVLTALVRDQAPWMGKRSKPFSEHLKPEMDIQAILTVLGRRTPMGETLDLTRTDLRGADLTRARLQKWDLSFAHLEGAILRDAQFDDAVLYGAHLNMADLSGVDLTVVANREDLRLEDATCDWNTRLFKPYECIQDQVVAVILESIKIPTGAK
jgi:hypothetical protein